MKKTERKGADGKGKKVGEKKFETWAVAVHQRKKEFERFRNKEERRCPQKSERNKDVKKANKNWFILGSKKGHKRETTQAYVHLKRPENAFKTKKKRTNTVGMEEIPAGKGKKNELKTKEG